LTTGADHTTQAEPKWEEHFGEGPTIGVEHDAEPGDGDASRVAGQSGGIFPRSANEREKADAGRTFFGQLLIPRSPK
jgi:hypothetical protein